VGRGRFVAGERERPVRFSGVATRDADRWAFVHSHASIGVSNDEFFD
jgi:SnoaL-like domain